MTTSNAEIPNEPRRRERLSLDEQARRQGVKPLRSGDDLIQPGMFDSEEELDEFLADLYASRRAGMA